MPAEIQDVYDKVVIITGASAGIDSATARQRDCPSSAGTSCPGSAQGGSACSGCRRAGRGQSPCRRCGRQAARRLPSAGTARLRDVRRCRCRCRQCREGHVRRHHGRDGRAAAGHARCQPGRDRLVGARSGSGSARTRRRRHRDRQLGRRAAWRSQRGGVRSHQVRSGGGWVALWTGSCAARTFG